MKAKLPKGATSVGWRGKEFFPKKKSPGIVDIPDESWPELQDHGLTFLGDPEVKTDAESEVEDDSDPSSVDIPDEETEGETEAR